MPAPRLRFKQFEGLGEWEEKPLKDVASIITRRAGNEAHTPMSITSGVGLVSQIEKFGRDIAGAQYKNYIVLEKYDFAYNKSATKDYPEGFLTMHTLDKTGAVPNSIFTCFRADNNQVFPQYLNFLFQENLHGKWLRKFISVGARANGALTLETSDLMNTPVPLPTGAHAMQEQTHIAACLSSLDAVIAAHTDKLDALRQHKRALMQRLFPQEGERVPRLRFPEFEGSGEWEEKTISELLAVRNIKKPPSEDMPLFSLTIEDGVTAKSERYDRGFLVGKKEQKTYKVVMTNDLVYNPANLRWGAIAVSKIRHPVVVSPIYEVLYKRPDIDFNENFVFESLMRPEQIKVFCLKGQGTLVERIAVKIDDFVTESIPLPPTLPEQQRIAACLSSLDDLISAQSEKIDELKTFKRGLMQGLFPSTTNHEAAE